MDDQTEHTAVHDTELSKVEGEGDWTARKHGGAKPCARRKVHLGIDERTLEISAAWATGSDIVDAPMLPKLLSQIPPDRESASVSADGGLRCAQVP